MIKLKMRFNIIFLCFCFSLFGQDMFAETTKVDQRIFVYGSDIQYKFIRYIVDLVDKPAPKICYIPTASADNADNIKYWNYICKRLNMEPYVLKVWIDNQSESFEKQLLGMDAIIVGGGNTLNMLGIWKYQGIDKVLKKALEQGTILSGGSAGSICWFDKGGASDSRPTTLSVVDGLNFLPYSHCPHYNNVDKKTFYHQQLISKKVKSGYACDDGSGILFTNGKITDVVSTNENNHSYFVHRQKGRKNRVNAVKLDSRILISKDAISETEYKRELINKRVDAYNADSQSMESPLQAYIAVCNLFSKGLYSQYYKYAANHIKEKVKDSKDRVVSDKTRNSMLSSEILLVLTYGKLATVISNAGEYYSLFYFHNEDGVWKGCGEDIGGDTLLESEIVFREKAKLFLLNIK